MRELAADDVRDRLFDALAPVQVLIDEAVSEATGVAGGRINPDLIRFVIEDEDPPRIQITTAPSEGRAKCIAAFEARHLPDGGAALKAAVKDLVAAILATLPPESAFAVVVNAAAQIGAGGIYAVLNPGDQSVVLAITKPGRSLGEGCVIGGIVAAPPTTH